jgi:hypothetical protein
MLKTRARRWSAAAAGAALAGAAHAQSLQDGSFEASGAAFQSGGTQLWQATSTNFIAPYCDSACLGFGQPGGARTGTFWVWFGGTSDFEAASVSQSVQIPSGTVQLRFYLLAGSDRNTNTDVLRALVDSTVVLSINNQQILPYLADYTPVTIDVSAFGGGVHTIRLEAVTQAGTGSTSFFVDDVSLVPVSACYPNCDASTAIPFLNVQDFSCFIQKFAGADSYGNCDGSTVVPTLNVQDFTCFLSRFAAGCSAP